MNSKASQVIISIIMLLIGGYLIRVGYKNNQKASGENTNSTFTVLGPGLFGAMILAFAFLNLFGIFFGEKK